MLYLQVESAEFNWRVGDFRELHTWMGTRRGYHENFPDSSVLRHNPAKLLLLHLFQDHLKVQGGASIYYQPRLDWHQLPARLLPIFRSSPSLQSEEESTCHRQARSDRHPISSKSITTFSEFSFTAT